MRIREDSSILHTRCYRVGSQATVRFTSAARRMDSAATLAVYDRYRERSVDLARALVHRAEEPGLLFLYTGVRDQLFVSGGLFIDMLL